MPYPESFIRHTLNWTLAGGEVASARFSWRSDDAIVALDGSLADELEARAQLLWDTIQGGYASTTQYIGSRTQWIGPTGLVLDTEERFHTPDPGTSGADALPTEVALVISTVTSSASRGGKGRSYFPNPAVDAMSSAGRFVLAYVSAVADASLDYITAFPHGASTFTAVVPSLAGAGFLRPVVAIKVGDVPDAQRRRRDAMVEVYERRDL